MAGQKYPRLSIEMFGKQLLETGDLDPIYLALHRLNLEPAKLHRWLLAYWCNYHAGASCYMSEQPDAVFWLAMHNAITQRVACPVGGLWPLGKERRYMRCNGLGDKAVYSLMSKYSTATDAFNWLVSTARAGAGSLDAALPLQYKNVRKALRNWHSFGSWISYKVGDMLDRVAGVPVVYSFDDAMYDTPREGALLLWNMTLAGSAAKDDAERIDIVVKHLLGYFGIFKAPPLDDRTVGLTEIETILCKWHSHQKGHYPLFNDIDEISHGLAPWAAVSSTAAEFLQAMPKKP